MTRRRIALPVWMLVFSLAASGCGARSTWHSSPVPTMQDLAGSAQVAVLSIAPWEEYLSALQPNFPMDEERALKEAIPNTMLIDREMTDVFGLGLKLALPTAATNGTDASSSSSKTSTATAAGQTTETASGETTTTATSSTVTKPGDVSAVTTGTAPAVGKPSQPQTNPIDGAVSVDPFVRYAAATSLFQEVRVLQRYVRDALISSGQRAYVVRVQVTLMPAQRHQPIDAYTTLSFFGTLGTPVQAVVPTTDQKTDRPVTPRAYSLSQSPNPNVRVIPLLVSDDLEGAMESASSSVVRQLAFGLLGMLSNAGFSAQANKSLERLQTLVGRELNSLMTVGQISDNTMRVRFGAMNQAGSDVAMVSRNQKVTLLVVLPAGTGVDSVRITSKTDFFNGLTGTPLAPQTRKQLQQRVDVAMKNYGVDVDESSVEVERLVNAVQQADPAEFRNVLNTMAGAIPPIANVARLQRASDALWLDIAAILSTLPYSVTTANLPAEWQPAIAPNQRPLALDDGKKLTITLADAGSLRGSDLFATLPVGGPGGGEVAATSVGIDGRGSAVLTFASLKGSGLCKEAPGEGSCNLSNVNICRSRMRWETPMPTCWSIPVVYRTTSEPPPPPPTTQYAIAAGARVIVATNAAGSLIVRVAKKDNAPADTKPLSLTVDGANVLTVKGVDADGKDVPVVAKGLGYEVASSATVTFGLFNLDPTVGVSVTGNGADNPNRIDLRVVAAEPAKPKTP